MDDERSVAGGSADEVVPDLRADAADHDKDPAEQEALARDLGEELTDAFARYVRGEVDFAEVSFLVYDTLQDLHIIASGDYELDYDDEDEAADDEDGDDLVVVEPDGDEEDTEDTDTDVDVDVDDEETVEEEETPEDEETT